jgi:geranylgeranyl diphosphate synthase type I
MFEEALSTGAALELLHSGILIADDIIDRDSFRRGLPTMHKYYEAKFGLGDGGFSVSGEDFAISISLFATYTGFKLLSSAPERVTRGVAETFSVTSLAEVFELELTLSQRFSLDDIIKLYELKTGHYSISLPVSCGALLAEREELLELIKKAGIYAGIAFQIKDDLIEIAHTQEETGKDQFSDFRAGRKTLAAALLIENADEKDAQRLESIYRSGGAKTDEDLEFIKELTFKYRIAEKLNSKVGEYSELALKAASSSSELKKIIGEIVEFNLRRSL